MSQVEEVAQLGRRPAVPAQSHHLAHAGQRPKTVLRFEAVFRVKPAYFVKIQIGQKLHPEHLLRKAGRFSAFEIASQAPGDRQHVEREGRIQAQ